MHALGVIAATFNRAEHHLLGLFLAYLGFNDTMTFLFARLRDNSFRIDLLRRTVAEKGESDEIISGVNHFCDAFDRAAQNRNILMHSGISLVVEDGANIAVVFTKGAKQDATNWNRYLLDVTKLRKIADEVHSVSRFGRRLFVHITSNYPRPDLYGAANPPEPTPFPDRPPLPVLLNPQNVPTAIASLHRQPASWEL
ncbi:hypothetical protein [Mesorhizobium sp. KR9-304]|uniref:hypothetical protein n=1 Tax=Mesorhizobium sp. KR9-304 TaxID=3156614 RepID=UPI0032B50E77